MVVHCEPLGDPANGHTAPVEFGHKGPLLFSTGLFSSEGISTLQFMENPRLIRAGSFLLFSRFAADRFRTVILLYHIANTDFARVKASFWGLFTPVLCHRGTLYDIS